MVRRTAGALYHAAGPHESCAFSCRGPTCHICYRRLGSVTFVLRRRSHREDHFIATSAEYTPRLSTAFDEAQQARLSIQARPSRPDALRVGQPISVDLNPGFRRYLSRTQR